MVHTHRLWPMKRDEDPHEEQLVLLLHRQGKPINDTPKDLQQLTDAAMPLCLEDESVEDVVDGLANERTVDHELAVDSVEDCFEILALAGVLGFEEIKDAEHEGVVDVALGDLGVSVGGDDVAEKELVDELKVGPGGVQVGILLLGVGHLRAGVLVGGRREAAEDVNGDSADELLLDGLPEADGTRLNHVDELR